MGMLWLALWRDEAGFIISAELILVATIAVLSSIVGLTSIAHAVNGELLDVANGFESLRQNPRYATLSQAGSSGEAEILGPGGF